MDLISAAISHFEYGISHDIFKEPVTSYARAAVNALRVQRSKGVEIDQVKNDLLTLDELRQMNGEPVYSVEITGREEWLFRRDGGFADMYGEFTSDDFMSWDNYGKLWWCYRQKPEEGTV